MEKENLPASLDGTDEMHALHAPNQVAKNARLV
jgi:hypothetical protein